MSYQYKVITWENDVLLSSPLRTHSGNRRRRRRTADRAARCWETPPRLVSAAGSATADAARSPRGSASSRRHASSSGRTCTSCCCGRRDCCCRALTRSAIRSVDRATPASRNPGCRWGPSSRRTCVRNPVGSDPLEEATRRRDVPPRRRRRGSFPWVNHGGGRANYTDRRLQLTRLDDPTDAICIIIRDRHGDGIS